MSLCVPKKKKPSNSFKKSVDGKFVPCVMALILQRDYRMRTSAMMIIDEMTFG
jgi:hypothetical protein